MQLSFSMLDKNSGMKPTYLLSKFCQTIRFTRKTHHRIMIKYSLFYHYFWIFEQSIEIQKAHCHNHVGLLSRISFIYFYLFLYRCKNVFEVEILSCYADAISWFKDIFMCFRYVYLHKICMQWNICKFFSFHMHKNI